MEDVKCQNLPLRESEDDRKLFAEMFLWRSETQYMDLLQQFLNTTNIKGRSGGEST